MMPRNPFTVRGRIRRCWLFSWRTPESTVRSLVPAPMRLVTRAGSAFWNIVVCEMAAIRPAPLPALVGISYWHVAYRLLVRVREADGEEREGLFFLRSDCDSPLVRIAGNLLTDFHFHHAHIAVAESGSIVDARIKAREASAQFRVDRTAAPVLADDSPFGDLAEAARFLQYQPRAFSPHTADTVNLLQVRRDERAWRSRVVAVPEQRWEFLAGRDAVPELCTEVEPIDYQWDRGRVRRAIP